ncbi:MAG: ammonia-forming cytochrome c nitrite reductase subunit c552 [Coriobacteriia bacterium]|nr:ammonia-forming cytochrome c nitrite reductase subunit c552 [Coriobacteriia bacterium]
MPRRSHRVWTAVAVLVVAVALPALTAGCAQRSVYESSEAAEGRESCGGRDCHEDIVLAKTDGPHAQLGCTGCHEGTGEEHATDPTVSRASIEWRIDACSGCHEQEAATYLYDDNAQPGPFGGSQRVPPQSKQETFPRYNEIVAGHSFAKEYHEEGAHAFMLEDHYATARGKFDVCVQCKSTKIAWAWNTGAELVVAADTTVTLTHTRTADTPASELVVPAGTTLSLATQWDTHRTNTKTTLPDGTVYTSRPTESEDATASFNWNWAATIAATKDTMPYGAGCNHCHDPHTAKPRLIRAAMLDAIERGGPEGTGGVNPYASTIINDPDAASATDMRILLCAQCHVEYTCGKSGVDGIVRDAFGWAKAKDLHDLYTNQFAYAQDWRHTLIGEPLIKSQHSETELYWESPHYEAGATCSDCHMPVVQTSGGREFRSHWFTSPYKYHDPELFAAFASATGLSTGYVDRPCQRCHPDRLERGIAQQQEVFERQKVVQELLATSAARLDEARDAQGIDDTKLHMAVQSHRKAHVLWENLIVSENSMGFHNFGEVMESMDAAERHAREALELTGQAVSR